MKHAVCVARVLAIVAIVGGVGLLSAGCSKRRKGAIRVDGSSTVFLISQAVAEDFSKATNSRVAVAGSGTGAGFKKFCRGDLSITGASRPIKQSEIDDCKKAGIEFVELPVAYDGLAVVVNLHNTWVDSLTVAELKTMWEPGAQGKIMRWDQIRPGFPDRPLRLFGAGSDSGTFDYFTHAINGKERACRGDYNASENDNQLVQGISMDENAIGYFGFAYYEENKDKLKLLSIDDGVADNGAAPVKPTVETIANGSYAPLSRPIFIYVTAKALGDAHVMAFATYYLENAARLAREVGYVPLPEPTSAIVKARLQQRTTGSIYHGKSPEPGTNLDSLLASAAAAPAPAPGEGR